MSIRTLVITILFLLLLPNICSAAINFPYIRTLYSIPMAENPFFGIGNNFSALPLGVKTALWNPASVIKTTASEVLLLIPSYDYAFQINKTFTLQDVNISTGSTNITSGIFFTDDISDTTTVKTRTISGLAKYAVDTGSLAINYSMKVGSWLAVGVSKKNNFNATLATYGNFPVILSTAANFRGITNYQNTGITIGSDGKLSYAHTIPGGASYTYTTDKPLWDGFLTQNLKVPTTTFSEIINSITINNDFVFSGAINAGKFNIGINTIPIQANARIDNSVKAIVNKSANDLLLYTPNFDPNNESNVVQWTTDPSKYSLENGYTANIIKIPVGEIVADERYRGNYSGNTTRFDLGVLYDINESASFGLSFENLTSSTLVLNGTGIASRFTSRINSNVTPNIDPISGTTWSPFSDTATVISGTENYGLESEKRFDLPKRFRIGIAMRKPIIIAIDFEQQTNNIKLQTNTGSGPAISTIKGLKLLRIGAGLGFLRGSTTLLFKPEAEGDPAVQAKLDSTFKKYPVLPAELNLGIGLNVSGFEFNSGFGVNLLSVLDLYQIDTINPDTFKTVYLESSIIKDNFQFSYLAVLDTIGTIAAYSNSGRAISNITKEMTLGDLKFINAFAIGYKF